MKTKYAIFNDDIYTVEVIVMGSGVTNVKVIEPAGMFIPSNKFDKRLIFSSRKEAENYLKKDEEQLDSTVTEH